MNPHREPLEGMERENLAAQVAVLTNELRNQRETIDDLRDELRYVKRALWGVILTVMGAMIIYLLTQGPLVGP